MKMYIWQFRWGAWHFSIEKAKRPKAAMPWSEWRARMAYLIRGPLLRKQIEPNVYVEIESSNEVNRAHPLEHRNRAPWSHYDL